MLLAAAGPDALPGPVAAAVTFTPDELRAIRYALDSTPPTSLYAAWMSAARKVRT